MARRALAVVAGTAALLGASVVVADRLSPRPGAAAIRVMFERGGRARHRALQVDRPADVPVRTLAYRDDLLVDVHTPSAAPSPLPVLVWTHGGAGLSGSRTDDAGWFARLAREGFVVAAVDYRLAPAATYPSALHDVGDAITAVLGRAAELGIDASRVVLGGDSAGAQMTAQLAAATTSPRYAGVLGLTSALAPDQLRGVVLACGYYDLDVFRSGPLPGLLRWGVGTIVRSLTGEREPSPALLDQMSSLRHVTAAFPPTFLLGGDGDPLTDTQSRPMADRLRALGVDVTTDFYDVDHVPPLPHEYQFDLSYAESRDAFAGIVAFLRRVTA